MLIFTRREIVWKSNNIDIVQTQINFTFTLYHCLETKERKSCFESNSTTKKRKKCYSYLALFESYKKNGLNNEQSDIIDFLSLLKCDDAKAPYILHINNLQMTY